MKARHPHRKGPKRLGRGVGSGHGKTSTKGHKGQRSRSGFHQRAGFEGGQNPLYRRQPKRGFNQSEHRTYAIINLDRLSRLGLSEITPEKLIEKREIKDMQSGLKVLGGGKMDRAVTVRAHRFSSSAKAAIEKAGGKALLIESKTEKESGKQVPLSK